MFETGKLTLGLNYWASENATRMWKYWNAESVEKDLALFAEYGVKVLRVFPLWSDFQPIRLLQYGGSVNATTDREVCLGEDERPLPDTVAGRAGLDAVMMERFREFCDIAQKYGIKLIVAIMTAHMTGRHFVPPAIENRDMMTDPFALKWSMKFYDAFVRIMKDHPAIAAWETGNEMNYTAPVKSADHAWVWTKMMHDIIRLADPDRPIVGVMAEGLDPAKSKWLIADQGELADYASVHRYDIQNPAAADGWMHLRNLCRNAAECRIISDIGGKPCFTEETGNWRNMALTLEGVGNAVKCLLWNAYAENSRAFLWWCAFDQENMEFAPYHWGDWPGLEHGVFSADGKAHPSAKAVAYFGKLLESLPFEALPEVKEDAICIVDNMEAAYSSYILARQAGINLKYQAARGVLSDANVYMLPSVDCRGGISTENWKLLREKVYNGASCYLSADDCNLPGLREFCGFEIASRRQATAPFSCELSGAVLDLKCDLEKRIQSTTAEVILRDKEGNALMLRNQFGKGVVYTLTFALEKVLGSTPRAYDQAWWKIYNLVIDKKLLMKSSDSAVILTEHCFDDQSAAVVAVNCSDSEREFTLDTADGLKIKNIYGEAVMQGNVCKLAPGAGAIFMLNGDISCRQ